MSIKMATIPYLDALTRGLRRQGQSLSKIVFISSSTFSWRRCPSFTATSYLRNISHLLMCFFSFMLGIRSVIVSTARMTKGRVSLDDGNLTTGRFSGSLHMVRWSTLGGRTGCAKARWDWVARSWTFHRPPYTRANPNTCSAAYGKIPISVLDSIWTVLHTRDNERPVVPSSVQVRSQIFCRSSVEKLATYCLQR